MMTALKPSRDEVTTGDVMTLAELRSKGFGSEDKLRRMAQDNLLPFPAVKIGRNWVVSREAYKRWLDSLLPN